MEYYWVVNHLEDTTSKVKRTLHAIFSGYIIVPRTVNFLISTSKLPARFKFAVIHHFDNILGSPPLPIIIYRQ